MSEQSERMKVASDDWFCLSEIEQWARWAESMESEECVSELVYHGAYGIQSYFEPHHTPGTSR